MRAFARTFAAPLAATLAACAIALASPAPPAPPVLAPAQWTQFRLVPSNNTVLAGTLHAAWRLTTGGGFSSSPTLSGGTVYAGNNAGKLFAIDVATGKILWQYAVQNPLMSAPLLYGDLAIVGEGNENSPDGSSPSHPIRVGDPPNALIAVNRKTGEPVWRVDLRGSGMPTPAIVDGTLVHHNGAGTILGLNPLTGARIFRRELHSIASMAAATPVGGANFVTAGIDPTAVWMLSAKDGSVMWKTPFSRAASGLGDCPPASDGTRIYCTYVMPPTTAVPVQTERVADLRAYAIDIRTGKKVWDVLLDRGMLPKRNEAAIPLAVGGTVYLGSSVAPEVHALDAKTGAVRWRAATHGAVKGGMVEVNGVLYFGDLGGYLWALDTKSGRTIGVKNEGTPFNVGSPIVAGKTLIIGSRGGTLMAVPLARILGAHDA